MEKIKDLDSYLERVFAEVEKTRTLTEEEKALFRRRVERGPFMDLRSDWAFKHLLNDHDVLRKLINDMLPVRVESVELLPNEIDRSFENEKDTTMDVLCRSKGGEQFVVEVQRRYHSCFADRMFYYGASMMHTQIQRGKPYQQLRPVFVLCFMDFSLPHDNDQIIYRYGMRELLSGERFPFELGKDLLLISLCELPRLQKGISVDLTPEEKWLLILKNLHTFADKPEGWGEEFDRVFEIARVSDLPDKEKLQYYRYMLTNEEKQELYADGMTIGRIEGKMEGLKEGKAEGKAEGLKEVARRMQEAGADQAYIKAMTGIDLN